MNVVGKVGSLITQGVYTVVTPFHPFGGAVDAIVVQQQDGTFRSTPWYVRFGKFQGVLKGAEKIVRINVNGVEANFHMYLDNSGEAYFVREVDDNKGIDSNGATEDSTNPELNREDSGMEFDIKSNSNVSFDGHRIDHAVSDSQVLLLKEKDDSLDVPQIQRAESDGDHRYYEFQEERSREGSVELPEYGSNRYKNLDRENFVDSEGSHSGVVLMSVDGHILRAPISESEQDAEDVQLITPQFHIGPGEGTVYVEGNEEFISGELALISEDADYISKLGASTSDIRLSNHCSTNGADNIHICHEHEAFPTENEEDLHMQSNTDVVAVGIKRESVFESCLELQELAQQVGDSGLPNASSPLEVQYSTEESSANCPEVGENEQGNILPSKIIDELSLSIDSASPSSIRSPNSEVGLPEVEKKVSEVGDTGSGSHSVTNDSEWNEHIGESVSIDQVDDSQQTPAVEDYSTKSELLERHAETYGEGDQCHSGLEISLCGHELKAGMGLVAASKVFEAHQISAEVFRSSASSIIENENLIIKFRERYLPWEKAAPIVLGMTAFGLELPIEPKDTIPVDQDDALKSRDEDPGSSSSGRRWRLWSNPFRKVKTLEHTSSNSSNEDIFVDSESVLQSPLVDSTSKSSSHRYPRKQLIRTNVPTSDQIASLNLKDGQNFITFSFSTRVFGTQQVDAHIYLWKWNARIVISDVDGTITKVSLSSGKHFPTNQFVLSSMWIPLTASDVLGQVMPLVGKDWAQSGVARLFSAIKENGYQLLFLSARAIVQAYLTRSFLLNLKQDGKALPNGPVVISPDGLFPSLFREVIRRAPHEFKIACLEDIKRLFPSDYNPFYAGFGNRDTDELSYRKIGIPKGKIFIINPKGEVAISSHRIDVKSYTSLHTLVNDMFPPTSLVEQEDFNSWNYWKMPLPDIE